MGIDHIDGKQFQIVSEPIVIEHVVRKVIYPHAGAVNTFIGTVREYTAGKRTLHLEYAAYVPMAEKQLRRIAREIGEKWPETRTAITHRIGRLQISDIAVVIATSSPHRGDAFAASRYAIERIKQIVPIWKKEYWEDGEAWIGDQQERVPYPTGAPPVPGEQADDAEQHHVKAEVKRKHVMEQKDVGQHD